MGSSNRLPGTGDRRRRQSRRRLNNENKTHTKAQKRLRQRYTARGLPVADSSLASKLKKALDGMTPSDVYRVDSSRGRRSIVRAEAAINIKAQSTDNVEAG